MFKEIRAVYLDLGGVYYTEGFREGLISIARKYHLNEEEFYTTAYRVIFDNGYVRGEAPEKLFWDELAEATGIEESLLPERSMVLAAFKPQPGMPELTARLREQIPVGLLTDQCNWLYELDERDALLSAFDTVVNSYEEGYTKKDMEIFRIACQRFNLLPEEIVFFDDSQDNIDMGLEFGMRAFLYEDPEKTERILRAEGVEFQSLGSGSGFRGPDGAS